MPVFEAFWIRSICPYPEASSVNYHSISKQNSDCLIETNVDRRPRLHLVFLLFQKCLSLLVLLTPRLSKCGYQRLTQLICSTEYNVITWLLRVSSTEGVRAALMNLSSRFPYGPDGRTPGAKIARVACSRTRLRAEESALRSEVMISFRRSKLRGI